MAKILSVQSIATLALERKPSFHVPWRPALMQYALMYSQAVRDCRLADPCMLAAIVARESSGQNILQRGVAPGPGCGVGLCQITSDVDWTNISAPYYPGYGNLLDALTNLEVGAHVFLES